MKIPMTADEFKNKEYSDVYWDENSAIDFAEEYSIYLLKHHLEQFAEELIDASNVSYVNEKRITKTLNDYLTKNNIR
jgi:hypothetical protein